jgi:tetratricopeptide (TPR) repeat protein
MRYFALLFVVSAGVCGVIQAAEELRWREFMRSANRYLDSGDLKAADTRIIEAVREAEDFGQADPRLAVTLNNFGSIKEELGEFLEAETGYRRALQVWAAAGGFEKNRARTLSNLVSMYINTGQYSKAEQLRPLLLAAIERADLTPADRAGLLNVLGFLAFTHRDLEESRSLYNRALETLGDTNVDEPTLASIHNNLGVLSTASHQPAEARAYLRKALSIWDRLNPREGTRVLINLAILDCEDSHFTEAAEEAGRALRQTESLWGPDHIFTAQALLTLAHAERGLRQKKDAAQKEKRARAILHKSAPETGLGYRVDVSEFALQPVRKK